MSVPAASPTSEDRWPVVIAGFGRLGGALALGLSRAGWPVSVQAHAPASQEALSRAGLSVATPERLRSAALVFVVVRDDGVAERAQAILPQLSETAALVHCAGALPLSIFGDASELGERPLASFHPLVAVSSREAPLAGGSVALSATDARLLPQLRAMAEALLLRPFEVNEARRAAYHAGAVLSAGGAVGLLAAAVQAFEAAGVGEADALAALIPLMRSALAGVEARGLADGLTGPIPRGDVGVVEAHLAALPPSLSALYRELGAQMLRLSALDSESREALERVLRAPNEEA